MVVERSYSTGTQLLVKYFYDLNNAKLLRIILPYNQKIQLASKKLILNEYGLGIFNDVRELLLVQNWLMAINLWF
jgi:hypothetical protein